MSDKQPVLLQLLPALNSGGVERGTIDIAKIAKEAGIKSLVASAGGRLVKDLDNAGVEHIQLPVDTKNPLKIFHNKQLLKDIISRYNVTLLHARSRAPAWSGYLAAKETGCRFLTTFHGTYGMKGFPLKKKYNEVMVKGERIIAVSQFIADHINKNYIVDPSKIRVVHRGVDTQYFDPKQVPGARIIQMAKKLGIPDDMPVILLPGRITRWKGHKLLLDALKMLEHRNFFCLFMGDVTKKSKYLDELEDTILDYGLGGHVHIVGNVLDMPAAYMLADVVVSASTDPEAFGRVAAEAQAMEKLIIATDHGGSKETVLDDQTGWLVDPADPDPLSRAIDHALELDKNTRRSMGITARRHIEQHFSIEQMQVKTLEVYGELLANFG